MTLRSAGDKIAPRDSKFLRRDIHPLTIEWKRQYTKINSMGLGSGLLSSGPFTMLTNLFGGFLIFLLSSRKIFAMFLLKQ